MEGGRKCDMAKSTSLCVYSRALILDNRRCAARKMLVCTPKMEYHLKWSTFALHSISAQLHGGVAGETRVIFFQFVASPVGDDSVANSSAIGSGPLQVTD